MVRDDDVDRFARLFAGRSDARGTDSGGCIHEPVSRELYRLHLQGTQSLGIYPLLDDGTCWWACADIDTAPRGKGTEDTHRAAMSAARRLIARLEELGVSSGIALERSKSRGVHVWLFFAAPAVAYTARALLRAASNAAGLTIEIFPKQDRLGGGASLGNYVHLPYLGGLDDRRVMLDRETGAPIPLRQFLDTVRPFDPAKLLLALEQTPPPPKSTRLTLGRVSKREAFEPTPCYRRLIGTPIHEGQRNDACAALAMHLNRQGRSQQEAESLLLDWNAANLPPLAEREVRATIKSVYARDYRSLWCEHPVIAAACSPTCPVYAKGQAARAAAEAAQEADDGDGRASAVAVLEVSRLTIISREPYAWRAVVNGQTLDNISTKDLRNFVEFQERCSEQLQFMPDLPGASRAAKQRRWEDILRPLIEAAETEYVPEEATVSGMLTAAILSFFDNRARHSEERADLLRGRILIEGNSLYFRGPDLARHLGEQGYDRTTINSQAWRLLRERLGGDAKSVRAGETVLRVWFIPAGALSGPVDDEESST